MVYYVSTLYRNAYVSLGAIILANVTVNLSSRHFLIYINKCRYNYSYKSEQIKIIKLEIRKHKIYNYIKYIKNKKQTSQSWHKIFKSLSLHLASLRIYT